MLEAYWSLTDRASRFRDPWLVLVAEAAGHLGFQFNDLPVHCVHGQVIQLPGRLDRIESSGLAQAPRAITTAGLFLPSKYSRQSSRS